MELLDIRTPDGKITGRVEERSLVHEKGYLHGTAHVWLIRKKQHGQFDILLQKRAAGKDSYPGFYDISSAGHIPAGQDYLESAVRELQEELGITVAQEQLKFIGMREGKKENIFYGKPFLDHEIYAVYVLETALETDQLSLQKEEVESVMWVDFDECIERIRKQQLQCCVYPQEFVFLEKAVREE